MDYEPALTTTVGLDPQLIGPFDSCVPFELGYLDTSPLSDGGDPEWIDAFDGSVSDIGAYGGPEGDPVGFLDLDGDGWAGMLDCDDENPALHPGAAEVCNGIDDDCDGLIDAIDEATDAAWTYDDLDSDGLGDPATAAYGCPDGVRVEVGGDCDDGDADVGGPTLHYADADSDGFGDPDSPVQACAPNPRVSANDDDCNDANPGVGDPEAWYRDADGDGHGVGTATVACDAPGGDWVVGVSDDCDDGDVLVFPGAVEQCNARDDNCNGQIDEDVVDLPWWPDLDRDGYGDPGAESVIDCVAPGEGWAPNDTDCDDADPDRNPGEVEVCGGGDENCNGLVDDDDKVAPASLLSYYPDADGDGYGDETAFPALSCDPPTPDAVDDGTDCDDADPTVHPYALEIPFDGIDQDCDGADAEVDPDTDSDSDGLTDLVEGTIGSDPDDPDTDSDGLLDGVEGVVDSDSGRRPRSHRSRRRRRRLAHRRRGGRRPRRGRAAEPPRSGQRRRRRPGRRRGRRGPPRCGRRRAPGRARGPGLRLRHRHRSRDGPRPRRGLDPRPRMDAMPQTFRSTTDRALQQELLEHPRLRAHKSEDDQVTGTRRALLAQSLRLTRRVSPDLFRILDRCRERLQVQTQVELFVFNSPQFNAACTRPEGDRVFVLLSSSLAEGFDADELTFVVGHELGHHIYEHHSVPLHALADPRNPPPAPLVLRVRAWQRYAEISADRAGLACCGGLKPAARSLFKLSSGFRQTPDDAQLQAYLDQAAELYREVEAADKPVSHRDWLSTHPFSPVRLSAARAFEGSEALVPGGTALSVVEQQVHGFMAVMEPSYLEEDSDEAESLRRILFAGGVLVASAVDPITDAELDMLKELLGPGKVPASLAPDALRADLPRRIERCLSVARPARRAAVVRDLATIARADGHVDPRELEVIAEIARSLQVDPLVVDLALKESEALD